MGTLFLTGAAGFVGRHLASLARAEGHEVVGVDRRDVEGAHTVDLRDADRLRSVLERARPTWVVHLAGVLRSPDALAFYGAHVEGTVALLEAVVRLPTRPRVVLASSSAVYGRATGVLREDQPAAPLTHYAASKLAQEVVAARAGAADGLEVVVARSFNVVGPGQPETLAAGAFARQIALAERTGRREISVGELGATRDFVDVRDVARAYLALAARGRPGGVYNVCSGVGTTLRALLDELLLAARVPVEVRFDAGRRQAHDVPVQIGDRSRIGSEVQWAPTIPLRQSLIDLLEDWRGRVAASEVA